MKLTFYKLKNQLDTFCQYDNHKRGGTLQLSSKFPIRKRQIRDIKAANKGLLAQKTWLDENSSLKGDWRLPQDTIFENSQIEDIKKDLEDRAIVIEELEEDEEMEEF